MSPSKVYAAISQVQAEIEKLGIAKEREVTDGPRFVFRGIDDVLNSFSGPMSKAKLICVPKYHDMVIDVRATAGGKANYNVKLQGTFTMLSLEDGSSVEVGPIYGEANDTSDKATAKAQSIALRQAYLQFFVVPLGASMDPEADGEQAGDTEPAPDKAPAKPTARAAEGEAQQPAGSELGSGQKKILGAKLKAKGITEGEMASKFGAVSTANFNKAMDWIGAQ